MVIVKTVYPDVARIVTINPIIKFCSNSRCHPICRQGDRQTRFVTCSFPINVTSNLIPNMVLVKIVYSDVARIVTINPIIKFCSNSQCHPIRRQGDRQTRFVTFSFPINVSSNLIPNLSVIESVYLDVTSNISRYSNGHCLPICRQGDCSTKFNIT